MQSDDPKESKTATSATNIEWTKWEVLAVHRGRILRKDCGTDLPRALELKAKAEARGLRDVTLRCKNIGHQPPLKYADEERVLVGRKKSTGELVYKLVRTDPPQWRRKMRSINRRGWWWCPFCMKLRKFRLTKGQWNAATQKWEFKEHFQAMRCPMCKISQRDWHVRRYNPIAAEVDLRMQGRKKRRRRSSR